MPNPLLEAGIHPRNHTHVRYDGGTTETAPAGNRGLDTTSRSKDSVMPYLQSSRIPHAVVYDGPMPESISDYYALAPLAYRRSFVYILTDANDDALYVGMGVRPGNRFDRHRRREWWGYVSGVRILQIDRESRYDARHAAKRLETALIRELDPYCNIAERVAHDA